MQICGGRLGNENSRISLYKICQFSEKLGLDRSPGIA